MPLFDDPWIALDAEGVPLPWQRAPRVGVYRYDGSSGYFELPNVECLSIHHAEGTNPGHAQFRYNLASTIDGAPRSFDQALSTGFTGPYVINPGDRLVVQAMRPDGVVENLFDGQAVDFGMQLGPESEDVVIGCEGIAKRAWDDVIGGAIVRDANRPEKIADTRTDLPAHFNPNGEPNCVPVDYMAGSQAGGNDYRYPTFLDPLVIREEDVRTFWTLPKACRYILYNANAKQKYVENPSGDLLDDLLVSPGANGDKSQPIRCPDTPITGKDWPGTIYRLIADCGFGMKFGLTVTGDPRTGLVLFANQAGPLKKLYLGAPGTPFDPTVFNVNAAALHRDVSDVVNTVKVKGGLTRWEASFVLAPGFAMSSTDKDPANLKHYDSGAKGDGEKDSDDYRLYVFDETGEGHFAVGSSTVSKAVATLDDLLGTADDDPKRPLYCKRRRKPLGDLNTRDDKGERLKATLWVSKDYAGPKPGLWDGTGTWQVAGEGGWHLLGDRLGVRITETNPNKWKIGDQASSGAPFPSGVVKGVEAQAATGSDNFHLRLTCVVEGDIALVQVAGPTANTAVPYPVTRTIDGTDRYRLEVVHGPSEFNPGTDDQAVRDDGKAALAEAQAIRAGSEIGQLVGSVTIPRITTYYRIGDRISEIEGRGLGLRTDGGAGGTEVYPVVIGRTFHFGEGSLATTLELSDAGTLRSRAKRQAGRRHAAETGRRDGRTRSSAALRGPSAT